MKKKTGFTPAERIFAQRLCGQAQETLKKVFCGICLRTRHDNAYKQTKRFKADVDKFPSAGAAAAEQTGRQKAFTLAEVLISLTIIGIIAAITVPALIQRTNKQEYVTALQKAYSTLSQATNMIIAENGSPKGDEGWADSVEHVYELYKKYLRTAKECSADAGCMPQTKYKELNSTGWKNFNWDTNNSYNIQKLVLADGAQVGIIGANNKCDAKDLSNRGSKDYCSMISVDVNGAKKPNTKGIDMFNFVLKENGLYPAGCDTTNDVCSRKVWGNGCACKVLREGAINY